MVDCEDEIAKRQVFDAFGNNVGGYLMFQCASDQDFGDDPFHLETEMYAYNTLACPEPPAKPVGRMQTRMFNWRGNEGSQTDVLHESVANLETWEDSSDPEIIPENDELRWPAYTRPSTGLIYMQARYYEPETGRFTQADPMPYDLMQLANGQNNRWTYCGNDPVNLSDPSGKMGTWGILLIVGIIMFCLFLLYLLYLFLNWLATAATFPRRANPCYITGTYRGDADGVEAFREGTGANLPPGCSLTGTPIVPSSAPSLITELINWIASWF